MSDRAAKRASSAAGSRNAAAATVRGAANAPLAGGPDALVGLQQGVGNRAVAMLLAGRLGAMSVLHRQEIEPSVGQVAAPPRRSTEAQWALTHGGQVASVGRGDEPNDEFILWNFLVGGDEMRRGHRERLRSVAQDWARRLSVEPHFRIRLIGSASSSGATAANEALALRRAQSVKDFLVAAGVPAERIDISAEGETKPLAPGADPASLARNRRVIASLYFETRVVSSLSGVAVSVDEFALEPTSGIDMTVDERGNLFAARLDATIANATVKVKGPSDTEVGFLQFLTADTRRATYTDDAQRRTITFDYSHCVGQFVPCRDVEFARLGFSFSEDFQSERFPDRRSRARPSATPTKLLFGDAPGTAFPLRERVPGVGALRISTADWSMEFVVVLAARRGAALQPLRWVSWRLQVPFTLTPPGKNPLAHPVVQQIADGSGLPPGLDIETAMSMPTCRLRTRTIDRPGQSLENRVCLPAIIR